MYLQKSGSQPGPVFQKKRGVWRDTHFLNTFQHSDTVQGLFWIHLRPFQGMPVNFESQCHGLIQYEFEGLNSRFETNYIQVSFPSVIVNCTAH